MGAGLLQNEVQLIKIVQRMRTSKISCLSVKIRLLETPEKTVRLIRLLFDAGVDAVTLHARTMNENRDLNVSHMDQFALVYEALRAQYLENEQHCLIYNGDIFSPAD